MTTRANYTFTVKEYPDGTPWIMLEPLNGNLPLLEDGFLGFDLALGTTYEQARALVTEMKNRITSTSHTAFR